MRLVLLFTALYLFCSCTYELEDNYGEPVPVLFTPSIEGETQVEVTTRVVNNSWSGNEVVGVTSVASGGSLPANAVFKQYKPAASGTSVTLNPTATDQTLYYPADGSNVNFFAFSPYITPTSNRMTYSAVDQSTQAKMEAIDFIWAKATGTHNKTNPNVSLTFAHKQSKIIIKVKTGAGVTTTDLGSSTATLTIGTIPTGGTYNLSDGSLDSRSSTGTITPYKSATTTTSVTWEAIVPPHVGADYPSRKFNFTFNSKSYSYPMPTTDNYEAGKSYTYDLTLSTSGVVLQTTTISNWTGGTTSWNGGKYVLRTPLDVLSISSTGSTETLQIQYQGTTTAPVAVTSTSSTSSTAGAVSWLTATVATTSTTSSPWTQRTLTITATSNTNTAERTGYIHVSLEGLSVVITVTQGNKYEATDGLANCYMVEPGGTITIPITRAITIGGAATDATFYPSKLWDDTTGGAVSSFQINGSGSNAVLKVTANNKPGNAVIIVRTGGMWGDINWSWHIWVRDLSHFGETWTNTHNRNNKGRHYEFMDRNLGAIKDDHGSGDGHGLFYQWGRKDPIPISKTTTVSYLPGGGNVYATGRTSYTGTVEYTIQYPNIFICKMEESQPSSDLSWKPGGFKDNELWAKRKTVFDPCPKGWRVGGGEGGQFDGIKTSHYQWASEHGMYIKEGVWFPYNGRCKCTSESSVEVQEYPTAAWYWAETMTGSENQYGGAFQRVGHLYGAQELSDAKSSDGYNVRCIRD